MRRLVQAIALLLTLLAAPAATAAEHNAPGKARAADFFPGDKRVSYSSWTVEGSTIRLRVMLPKAAADALAEPGKPPPRINEATEYVLAQFTAKSAGGKCEPIDQGEGFGQIYTLALTPGLYRYQIIFRCPDSAGIELGDSLLFIRVPDHVHYARVVLNGGQPTLHMFNKTHQTARVDQGRAGSPWTMFARDGAKRLVRNAQQLSLLAAILVLILSWKDLGMVLAGLAGGYAASLALALSGLVVLDRALWPGALAVLIGALGIVALSGMPGGKPVGRTERWIVTGLGLLIAAGISVAAGLKILPLGLIAGGIGLFGAVLAWASTSAERPAWLAAAPAALFSFLDGSGQASRLALLQLPARPLAPALIGHDLAGLAISGGALTLLIALIWLTLRRLAGARAAVREMAGAGLVAAGAFWFVSALVS